MNCGLPTLATNHGGPAEIIIDGVSGFHIDPRKGEESSNKIADFFQKCKEDAEHWNIISSGGLNRIYECGLIGSYTWKIYANKVLNMGSIYSFWRQVYKDQKIAKKRYIEMFYNFQFRSLVKKVPLPSPVSQQQEVAKGNTKPLVAAKRTQSRFQKLFGKFITLRAKQLGSNYT